MKRQNRVAFFNILSVLLLNGISVITAPLFSRLLGTTGYGNFKIYNIGVSVVAILFTLQTQQTLANARVEWPEAQQKAYQSSAMALSTLTFLTLTAAVLLLMEPISALLDLEPILIGLMLLQAFGTYCVDFLSTKYTYEFKAGRNMVMSLAVTLVTLVLSLILVLRLPYETRYYGRVVAIALTYGLLGIPVCLSILTQGRTFFHRDYWKFCIVLSAPAVFHNLTDLVLSQSDMVMLRQMVGTDQVGQYSTAWQLANIMFVIFGALNRIWCPFFFEELKLGQIDSMLAKSRNFLELFTILSCGFILLAPEVYHIYVDQTFWASTTVIPLFVGSYYLNFLCTFPVNFEYYHKKPRVVALLTFLCSLLNIVMNYFLIRFLGMAGAALATMLSHGIQMVAHHLYCRRLANGDYPFPLSLWAKYALAFFAVMALVYATPNGWLLRWGFGAVLGLWELLRIRQRRVLI